MVADLFSLMWAPFLMCLVLTGIHTYLGIHVIAREVVFVDIALAQIAALGATLAFLAGYTLESGMSYAFALGATLLGALVLALTRSRERRLSQEAVIGVVYAVSAAGAVLLVDRAPHGAEHLRVMLVGSILSVNGGEVLEIGLLYAAVGAFHWACRRPFLLISTDADRSFREGWRVRLWDLLFYASFGLVVTSSVRIAGVLLVFSYLIVPALASLAFGDRVMTRLMVGWAFGIVVSLIGMVASALLDLPTGAAVVCAFGLALLGVWGATRAGSSARWLVVLLCLVTFAGPAAAGHGGAGGYVATLRPDYVKRLLDAREPLLFVDLRKAEEFRAGHLPGAISLPITELRGRFAEIPRDRRVLLYCDCPAEDITTAYIYLVTQGYRNHAVLEEGFDGWVRRSYPLVK